MNLKSEKVVVDGVEYVATELPVKKVMPLVQKMNDNDIEAQLKLIGMSVSRDGVLMGDEADNIGTALFMKLIKVVMDVNGMSAEGNAS